MATPEEKRAQVAGSYLDAAERDLEYADAALSSAAGPMLRRLSPLIAYSLQQAAEKVAKAYIAANGGLITKEHRLAENIKLLKDAELIPELKTFIRYDAFATTARYPTPSGRLVEGPDASQLADDHAKLRAMIIRARQVLGVPSPPTR